MHQLFLDVAFWALHWLIVLPAGLIVSTPYVLIASLFDKLPYVRAVARRYRIVRHGFAEFWKDGGWGFKP